jgi:RNA polymerase sigma-70 factor (ECF subfamily)
VASVGAPPDFDAVYAEHFGHVARWLRAFGVPASEADDVTQEVFLVVRRKLARFDGRHLAAWLYRIAQRTASDHRRRAWFRRLVLRSPVDPESLASVARDPHASLERRDADGSSRACSANERRGRTGLALRARGYSALEIAELEGDPGEHGLYAAPPRRRDFLRRLEQLSRIRGGGSSMKVCEIAG